MLFIAQDAASSLTSFLPLLLIGAFFWFVMIRPQRKRAAERKDMIESLGVGSDIITIGGVHGVVEALGEEWVDVLVTEDVVIRVTRSAVGQVLGPDDGAQLDDDDDLLELDDVGEDDEDSAQWPSQDDRT